MQDKTVTLRNGNAGTVVKLLIVEHNGDELPPTHWHNANGSFYADAQSPLDVVDINQG